MKEKDQHPTSARTFYTSVDVARRAGVSRTTVSYVLNGNWDGHVSDETRKKVLQAAEELGYGPDESDPVMIWQGGAAPPPPEAASAGLIAVARGSRVILQMPQSDQPAPDAVSLPQL